MCRIQRAASEWVDECPSCCLTPRGCRGSNPSSYVVDSAGDLDSCTALSRASVALLGEESDTEALLNWLERHHRNILLGASSLSALDSDLTASEVVGNVEQLLALEKDTRAADRLWSGDDIRSVAERAVG